MKNQTALVTGASNGIGKEIARVLAGKKIDLVLVARSAGKLESLKKELESQHGIEVTVVAMDLGRPDAAQALCDQLASRGVPIDILVNNAGFGEFGRFIDTDWSKEMQMLQLNIVALTQLTKLFLPAMVARKSGRVLNVASTAAFQPGPLMSVYYATKAYVLMFSEGIANELKGTGVTVTTLCPGPTASGFQEAASLGESKLVKGRKLPGARGVAELGVEAMFKGKTVVIHGAANWFGTQLIRFLPRNVATSLVRTVQERAGQTHA